MSDTTRSEQACPVCGQHTLALDEPPHIDVMGIQPYSDMLGMGDLPAVRRAASSASACGTHWRDREAFDRGDAEPDEPGAGAGVGAWAECAGRVDPWRRWTDGG